jgi:hypothetical protein
MSSNFRVVQPIGEIYGFTGRTDYLDVLRDAVATLPEPNLTVAAAHAAVAHPGADQTPPVAVHDVTVNSLGKGRVQLSWTAPGDDGSTGQAAWYQMKCSRADIVERVSGWPDLSEPLPVDEAEWHRRAAEFNKRQIAFWAAENIDGEPAPGPAGHGETCVLDGLTPGRYFLALKTWDDDCNMSELSNVVYVDVK